MARYAIEDTTLTAIGDAIREKTGRLTRMETQTVLAPAMKVSKTPNALSFTEFNGGYGNSQQIRDYVTIDNAVSIKVKMAYQTEGVTYDYVNVWPGHEESGYVAGSTNYGGKALSNVELLFENTDTVTFCFRSDSCRCKFQNDSC
jgi:hypothetical protein